MCVCHGHGWCFRVQKGVLDLLKLTVEMGLQTVVSHDVGAENSVGKQRLLTTEPSIQSLQVVFEDTFYFTSCPGPVTVTLKG